MSNETLKYIVLSLVSLGVASILAFLLKKLLAFIIKRNAKHHNTDPTNVSFLKNSIGFLIYMGAVIFIFYQIPPLRSLGKGLFAGVSIFAVAIGFASQKAFSNVVGGVFILIFRPFKMTDTIEFKDGQKGVVEEITLRHTVIKDYENRRIIIPNSVISEATIINSSIEDEKIRKHIVFSISYDSDIDHAISVINDEALKHPLTVDNRTEEDKEKGLPILVTRVIALSDFSIDLKCYLWSKNNGDAFILKSDLLKSVKERFDKEGIEIPFPYRTIVYKKTKETVEK